MLTWQQQTTVTNNRSARASVVVHPNAETMSEAGSDEFDDERSKLGVRADNTDANLC